MTFNKMLLPLDTTPSNLNLSKDSVLVNTALESTENVNMYNVEVLCCNRLSFIPHSNGLSSNFSFSHTRDVLKNFSLELFRKLIFI